MSQACSFGTVDLGRLAILALLCVGAGACTSETAASVPCAPGGGDCADAAPSESHDAGALPDSSRPPLPNDAGTTDASDTDAHDAHAGDASDAGGGPGPGPTQVCPIQKDADGFFQLTSAKSDYWVRLPGGYDPQNPKPTALLVAIHGCGDSAYNFATWGAVPWELRSSHTYIGISVGGRDGQCWSVPADGALVTAAIEHVRSCFYVHQKKIVLAGFSSGGELSYNLGMRNAGKFAGILIENSGLTEGVGASNVASVLANAAWKINVAHSAHLDDEVFAIDSVRKDRDAMLGAGFPVQYREVPGTHDGTSADWVDFLIPKMAGWVAP